MRRSIHEVTVYEYWWPDFGVCHTARKLPQSSIGRALQFRVMTQTVCLWRKCRGVYQLREAEVNWQYRCITTLIDSINVEDGRQRCHKNPTPQTRSVLDCCQDRKPWQWHHRAGGALWRPKRYLKGLYSQRLQTYPANLLFAKMNRFQPRGLLASLIADRRPCLFVKVSCKSRRVLSPGVLHAEW